MQECGPRLVAEENISAGLGERFPTGRLVPRLFVLIMIRAKPRPVIIHLCTGEPVAQPRANKTFMTFRHAVRFRALKPSCVPSAAVSNRQNISRTGPCLRTTGCFSESRKDFFHFRALRHALSSLEHGPVGETSHITYWKHKTIDAARLVDSSARWSCPLLEAYNNTTKIAVATATAPTNRYRYQLIFHWKTTCRSSQTLNE
jgi:hypothetical protein